MQEVESARLAYVRFKKLPVGHLFIVFRYTNGEEVAISPEAKTKNGERFSLLQGFFRVYRLHYFIRNPRDLTREYQELGRQVTECSLHLTRQELQLLNQRVLSRAQKLVTEPEWYHPVLNSCLNAIINHLDHVRGRHRHFPVVFFIFAPARLCRL